MRAATDSDSGGELLRVAAGLECRCSERRITPDSSLIRSRGAVVDGRNEDEVERL